MKGLLSALGSVSVGILTTYLLHSVMPTDLNADQVMGYFFMTCVLSIGITFTLLYIVSGKDI